MVQCPSYEQTACVIPCGPNDIVPARRRAGSRGAHVRCLVRMEGGGGGGFRARGVPTPRGGGGGAA
jgi:hypothetical protein